MLSVWFLRVFCLCNLKGGQFTAPVMMATLHDVCTWITNVMSKQLELGQPIGSLERRSLTMSLVHTLVTSM